MKSKQTFARSILGQGMTEYIIIVALIAVSAIGVFTAFGDTMRNQVAGLATELSGQDAAGQITASQTDAGTAQTEGEATKGLGAYNSGAGE